MRKTHYNLLTRVAILLTVTWIGWSIYDGAMRDRSGGESAYHAGNKYFEDGLYEDALYSYQKAVSENPQLIHAKKGIALSLMQLERYEEALAVYDQVIIQEPEVGVVYANRGILHDRMHNYTAAIADYQKALQLNPELADGPRWLTRFFRNQVKKPPTILDRMKYLQAELTKPEEQRVLKMPEEDKKQQPYKL